MLKAAEKLTRSRNDLDFIIAENSIIDKELYDSCLEDHKDLRISRVKDNTFEVLGRSDFAFVASGTATLEATLTEKPMVIVYQVAHLTAILFRLFIRMSHIGLPNIIAGWRTVVPELLQYDATPDSLSRKTLEVISDPVRMEKMKNELASVKHLLGERGASRRAAEAISRFVKAL